MIWVTSDFHFGHDKDFIYGPRGYTNIYEEAEDLISKYNSVVNWDDMVYILGDCMLGDNKFGLSCLRRLAGWKYLILGNHDTNDRIQLYEDSDIFMDIQFGHRLKYNHWTFLLNHYPVLTENYQDRHKVISLCGHSHTTDPFLHWPHGLIYHCEVDAHGGYPVSIDQIVSDIKSQLNT